ncbi:MAG: lamin tail domain-containing protein [Caldilineaceae bacterium]
MLRKYAHCCGLIFALGLALSLASLAYAADAPTTPADQTVLRLNEFMVDNHTLAVDPKQPTLYPAWVEIYNPSANPENLDGLFLTDVESNHTRVPLPTGITVAAHGFVLFYADFRPDLGAQHLNLTLTKSGGFIGLYANQGSTTIDSVKYKTQYSDVSEGRSPDGDGQWRYMTQSTPNNVNAPVTPLVRQILRTPVVPTANDQVAVTALITDNGAMQATLFYNVGDGNPQSVPMVAAANLVSGTKFTASLPIQSNGTRVHYYVAAQDNDNLTSTGPLDAPTHAYAYEVGYQPPKLSINELMADNGSIKFPGDTTTPDWIELYNPNATAVDLSDDYLTTDKFDAHLFAIATGASIPANGYLVFFADRTPNKGPLHTNFSLKEKTGGLIELYDELSGTFLDSVQFGPQALNTAYARVPDGSATWQETTCASPGRSNGGCGAATTFTDYLPLIQK